MTIYIFGNPDLPQDALPLRILDQLKRLFPAINFLLTDPNEEFGIPEDMIIIDTVMGIDRVKIFSDPDKFSSPPRISLHNFDLAFHLKYLKKLGKLKKIKIIGIPPTISEKKAAEEISAILTSNQL